MIKNEKYAAWIAFTAVSFFWGTTFMFIRIGVQSFPPFIMAGLRHSIGGVLIVSYFLFKGYKMPSPKNIFPFIMNGFLMLVLGNGLVSYAETSVSSGLAALICSLTPVWILFFNSFKKEKEKLTPQIIAGIILCLVGQFFIFKDNISEFSSANFTLGIIAVCIANFSWAYGSVYARHHKTEINPLLGAGLQMLAGGFILDVFAISKGELSDLHPTNNAVWSLAYLIFFGSIIGYGAYMYVLKKLPAAVVSTYAYINTIVAVLLGWIFLYEDMNIQIVLSVALTIFGLWLVNKRRQ